MFLPNMEASFLASMPRSLRIASYSRLAVFKNPLSLAIEVILQPALLAFLHSHKRLGSRGHSSHPNVVSVLQRVLEQQVKSLVNNIVALLLHTDI